jgi:hypothetical protein
VRKQAQCARAQPAAATQATHQRADVKARALGNFRD